MLRLAAPALIARLAGRKRFCLAAYCASALTLLLVPLSAVPKLLPSAGAAMSVLIALWCVYHLLEYLATVALWSWLADSGARRIRGRFLGRRKRWMVAGQAAGLLATGLFSYAGRNYLALPGWLSYVIPAALGALLMLLAVLPLCRIPALGENLQGQHTPARRRCYGQPHWWAPLADRRFRRLLAFGCWFSFFNGLTSPAQDLYLRDALLISLLATDVLQIGMRLGQWVLSPRLGRLADRIGTRPVMVVSVLLVAAGPLFYLAADREHWGWIVGAWALWIAWSGINVCLPNLMLNLAPRQGNVPHVAAYYALTGLCVAASMIAGGAWFDRCHGKLFYLLPGWPPLNYFQIAFLLGPLAKGLAVLWLLRVVERKDEG